MLKPIPFNIENNERQFNPQRTEYDTWKNAELKKIQEGRFTNDLTNFLIKNDKQSRKFNSMDPKKTMKSSLNNVNFNKLNEIRIETLPKADVSEEKLKENLKDFIGMKKYPLDYQEINFEVPKSNFVRFEPLKTHMSSFKQNFEKS